MRANFLSRTRKVGLLVLAAALATGCSESPLRPVPAPAGPPRVEEVIERIQADAAPQAWWMVPELLEEAAVGVRVEGGSATLERIDFAAGAEARRERAALDAALFAAFLSRLEENGIADQPPATEREGVRIWWRSGEAGGEVRVPRSSPLAEVFRRAAEEALPPRERAGEGEASGGFVSALETGPLHLADPTFGPDGEIYAKAGRVFRYDEEARRFVAAFDFPPGLDLHQVQWEVPTRVLVAFHSSRIPLDLSCGSPSVTWNGRFAASIRPDGPSWVISRLDLATDETIDILRVQQPVMDPVLSEDGRWLAFGLIAEEGGPVEARVYDVASRIELDPGEGRADVHRPIGFSPVRRTFCFTTRELDRADYEVYLFSIERGDVEMGFRYHPAEFSVLEYLPDGRALVRRAIALPSGGTLSRLGVFEFDTSLYHALSIGDAGGPGSLSPSGDRFVYEKGGDVYLWRSYRPGEGPR
ncbi:MAG: hypothetical protein HY720_25450 [Planctomycetes bacterium]|nr:hypothetical protein [Planctomycetota bacterium]